MNIFELAAREKLRFPSSKGLLLVEDLFQLSLVSLNEIAKKVNKDLKDSGEEDFLVEKPSTDKTLESKLEILKFIITEKKDLAEKVKKRAAIKAELDLLKQISVSKKMEQLESLSLENINERMKELENASL